MLRFLFWCAFILSATQTFAEPKPKEELDNKNVLDIFDINKYLTKEITNKFPSTRLFNISYQLNSSSDYKSKLYKEPYENGTSNFKNLEAAANIPFYNRHRKLILAAIGRYNRDWISLKNISSVDNTLIRYNQSDVLEYYLAGLNATYLAYHNDKLIILNATLMAEGGHGGFQRIKGYLYASYAFKKSKDFNMTAGLIGIIDKTTSIPVAPSFTLSYKFSSGWTFDLFLPKSIYIRKVFLNNSRISLGTQIDSQSYYMKSNITGEQKEYLYKQNQLQTGALFEHQISELFIISLEAGMQNTFGARLLPKGKSHKHDIMTMKVNPNFYFKGSFSINF